MKTENNVLGRIEAMLFAAGEPVEAARIAEILELDVENVTKMLASLADIYEERNSGICLIRIDGKYQLCTKEEYAEDVRKLLEIKKNTPLSQAAFEVLAIIAYNKTVTKSFIEQIRGVDCSGSIANLVQKGLIEEKGRLDLPGRPLVYGTTDRFLRCFSLNSLEDLPDLPKPDEAEKENGQTTLFDESNNDKIMKEIDDSQEEGEE